MDAAAGAGRLLGRLQRSPPAAGADQGLGLVAVRIPGRERLEVRLVATMGSNAVHPRRLRVEAAHRDLAADRTGAGHGVLEIGRVVRFAIRPVRGRAGVPGRKAREGRYDSTRVARLATGPADPALREDARGVPTDPTTPTPGRSLVSRRAVVDVVRSATLGSYGVIGFAGSGWLGRVAERLGLAPRGIRVHLGDGIGVDGIGVDLDLLVAHGLPIAEVARQVDSAVRYAVRRALGREIDRLAIHVDGLRVAPYDVQLVIGGRRRDPLEVSPDELASSGTDVA